jgi:carbonic anhydrase
MKASRVAVRLLVSLAIASIALVAAAPAASPAKEADDCRETPWSYHPPTGPERWPSLNPCYAPCAGGEQSPIDLRDAERRPLPPLGFFYGKVPLHVVHTGHDIKANLPTDLPVEGRTLRIRGVAYHLVQFHFHRPSEHTVRGKERPVEIHLVHEGPGGRVAVVGIFIVPGAENPELSKIWKRLPQQRCQREDVQDFNLRKLLPRSLASFRYAGSLTTPACGQGVAWNVLASPITMLPKQIEEIRKLFSGKDFPKGNRRPVQPLNGRELVTDVRGQ